MSDQQFEALKEYISALIDEKLAAAQGQDDTLQLVQRLAIEDELAALLRTEEQPH